MDADISSQDRFYRRGLVLGFTLAEIAVLIIFALLLLLSVLIARKDQQLEELDRRLGERDADILGLTQRVEEFQERLGRGDDFDDFFKELELAQATVVEQSREIAGLRERIATQEEQREALEGRANSGDLIVEIAGQAGLRSDNPEQALQEIATRLEHLQSLEDHLIANGLDVGQMQSFVEETLSDLREAEARVGTLEGQLRNLQRDRANLGRGTEMPACWANRESGRPEYIFNTALTTNGIIVRDNALPHRAEEQVRLPLQMMVFDKEVTPSQYLEMARPLYDWSVENECRFFVRVFDLTGDEEKLIYKDHLSIVEQRFYKFISSGTFEIR